MILVDTTVWIDFFSKKPSLCKKELHRLIEEEEDVCLLDIILTEILQGIKEDGEFEKVREHLLQFPILRPKGIDTFIMSAQIYRLCRREGKTIRRTIDCLISACAIEHKLPLFHNDRDFDLISEVVGLKVYKV
ncbi:MAG: PIN domain nuclease [Candidatus Desantisbacteria bacterium]